LNKCDFILISNKIYYIIIIKSYIKIKCLVSMNRENGSFLLVVKFKGKVHI